MGQRGREKKCFFPAKAKFEHFHNIGINPCTVRQHDPFGSACGAARKINSCEFFRIDIGDGVELDGWSLKPSDFDPEKKYPVLFHVYGEPAGQVVRDRWGGRTALWHRMLAQQGTIVIAVDNRGTPSPRGREFRKSIYRQIGILASADQAAATRALLEERPYLDEDRVAIWGWSGGGSMTLNALFRHSG